MMQACRELNEWTAQAALQPGTAGWWEVWGATPAAIKAGDIVALATPPGEEADIFYVEDVYTAAAAPMRRGLVVNGERVTIGALCTVAGLFRRGTHHTLA